MSEPVRLGLLGCGTVGSAVVRAVATDPRLAERYAITAVAVRDLTVARDCPVDPATLTSSPMDVVGAPGVDMVIEVMGGTQPAGECIQAALSLGKPVVTANKALLAEQDHLTAAASEHATPLRFEAAVAGAIPAVRTLRQLARTETIHRLDAVLNGTTTYVLGAMAARGMALEEAVAEAQRCGYAEADPSRDLDGRDAADKLTLLSRLLWGTPVRPSEIHRLGLTALTVADVVAARENGEAWQVVATATPACARVELVRLPMAHPFSRLDGTDNAVQVRTQRSGTLTFTGPGAGGDATAAAILADLDEIATARSTRDAARAA